MNTWIVGLDGSTGAQAALRWAAGWAERRHERVEPVTTWHVPLSLASLAAKRSFDVDRIGMQAIAEAEAGEAITAVTAIGDRASVIDALTSIEGHPAPTLVRRSSSDVVLVVGRRGDSRLEHRLLGSVSQYVATHSHGPVVVVPEAWASDAADRIVVGFDGSDHSVAALRWAIEIAPPEATVVALIAVDIIPWLRPELVEQRHPAEVEEARTRLSEAADMADPDRRATREFVLHGPRQALAEACSDADLVVVGPRGLGGIGRALLGSVTSWLLHEAPCPVAVVPSPPAGK